MITRSYGKGQGFCADIPISGHRGFNTIKLGYNDHVNLGYNEQMKANFFVPIG